MILRYTDRAVNDLNNAFSWYETQRRGLGFDFLDCVEASIKGILIFPEMHVRCYDSFRRCLIRRFPFSIFYSLEDGQIVVHAVLDNRCDPALNP